MGQQPSQSARGLHLIGWRYLSFGTETYYIIPIGFVDYFALAFEEIIYRWLLPTRIMPLMQLSAH